jgi:UDP:flavonoid glycosyltransferase YjiC (YdhE family)
MPTLAVLTIDLGGHLRPALRLAAALRRAGYRVIVWAPARVAPTVREMGCEHVPQDLEPFQRPLSGLADFTMRQASASLECVPRLVDELLDREVDLVVHDVHAPWGRIAADYLGLPRIVSDPLYPDWGPRPPIFRELYASSWAWPAHEALHPTATEHAALRRQLLARWAIDLGDEAATLQSTGEWTISYTTGRLLGVTGAPAGWCLAGPLALPHPRTSGPGPPLVYAALGTSFNRSRLAFATIVEALAGLKVDAIVSTGGSFGADELRPLPPNVTVERWVDPQAVLARAAIHVTHGGGGSVHESLLAGVPMVCLPVGADQWAWAGRVVACGAGALSRYEPPELKAAIARVLHSPAMRISAETVGEELRGWPGASLVGAIVDAALRGERYKGPPAERESVS